MRRVYKHLVLNGVNRAYLEELFVAWKKGEAVEPSIAEYFKSLGSTDTVLSESAFNMRLIRSRFETRGHYAADLDPLSLAKREVPADLKPEYFGFPPNTVIDEIEALKTTYMGKIGWEFGHISDPDKRHFLRERVSNNVNFSKQEKKQLFSWLCEATQFEKFLGVKYNAKRFGLDGGEGFMVSLKTILERGSELGVGSVVMGMAHRGRLNVLCNIAGKPVEALLQEFEGVGKVESDWMSGDVKYHLGASNDVPTQNGKKVHVSILANPSHLEAVNPVAVGKTAAKQYYSGDVDRTKIVCVTVHGDAALAGQGVCYETIGFSDLVAYTTGGTIHIVINNQIGFTTDPYRSRSQPYCTDLGKTIQAPIFHVNGDDIEAVARVTRIAVEYRQRFGKDVVIDVVCYRRFGHNELDNPNFTQPLMYDKIKNHPIVDKIYGDQLVKEGTLTEEERQEVVTKAYARYVEAYANVKSYKGKQSEWLSTKWDGFKSQEQKAKIKPTHVSRANLSSVAEVLKTFPEGFTVDKKLLPQLVRRSNEVIDGDKIDWATSELLAFGTLLQEGIHVRLSGQDVERGTFSQRHAVVYDSKTNQPFSPLKTIADAGSTGFAIHNSSLSEFGILGFELGYSLENPNALVMWEAQFGDFANTAQVIIDQFISSGENKWMRQSGITMLLPHGYDGQGPEHSSARLERFLQMVDEDDDVPDLDTYDGETAIQKCNLQVTMCTRPANHFHVLRRQVHREFRKPLICMVSKAHLKGPYNLSKISDFTESSFLPVIRDPNPNVHPRQDIQRVIFCSGQVYYQLDEFRKANPGSHYLNNVVVVRIEQLSPFPFKEVADICDHYSQAEVVWCQEEHKNMGSWFYVQPRLSNILKKLHPGKSSTVKYIGRAPSAAAAAGSSALHEKEKKKFLTEAFNIERETLLISSPTS